MKAIPEQLRAYFPKAINADRPWWNREEVPMGFFVGARWSRPDGHETTDIDDRESIDKANPLPPPPILVGQVWALQVPGSPLRVGTVTHTWQDAIVTVGISGFGMNLRGDLLLEAGFLLACPYGYAPWSGPEVP